jgi:competence protein ComEC
MTAVVVYGLLALPSPPVVRSVLLCLCFGIGIVSRRAIDNIQLLALTVLAMLVYHPLDLFSAGFQLSFGTVLGLMLFAERTFAYLGGTPNPDERVALGLEQPKTRFTLWFRCRRALLMAFAPGLVAWGVSLPLIAYHFEQINPWAILASLLLAPFVFVALIGGFVKIVLTAVLPFGATWWAAMSAEPVAWMRYAVDLLAKLPGSDVPLPAKSISLIVIYYALLCIPLLPAVRPRLKRTLRLAPACAVLLLAILPVTGGATGLSDGSLRLTMLAVGAGQCGVLELPDGRVILLDAGSATLSDPVRRCIGPFLRSRGRAAVDEIWLTDGDFDHLGAANEIIKSYGVPRVIFGPAFEQNAVHSAAGETLLRALAERNVTIERPKLGNRRQLGKGVTMDVLWPPGDASLIANESDLVLKLTYARRTILLPADIQQVAQARLLREPEKLRCDVLIAPHHGSGEATTAAFVAAADPLYVVSSSDRTLSQKQRLFERQIGNRPLFRTNESGAVTITIDRNGGVTVTPFLANQATR